MERTWCVVLWYSGACDVNVDDFLTQHGVLNCLRVVSWVRSSPPAPIPHYPTTPTVFLLPPIPRFQFCLDVLPTIERDAFPTGFDIPFRQWLVSHQFVIGRCSFGASPDIPLPHPTIVPFIFVVALFVL